MAEIFNDQRVRGVVLQEDGATLFNNQPVVGVVDAGEALFVDNKRTLKLAEVDGLSIYNEQPVLGAVLVEDGRNLYNNLPVIPVMGLNTWDPLKLFADGTDGTLWEPLGLSTLFQDAEGTTPVTAGGDPVRLVLDKSRGLTLGPEKVINGDFSNGSSGWTLGTSWSIVDGKAAKTTSGVDPIHQDIPALTSGATYQIELDQTYVGSGPFSILLRVGAAGAVAYSAVLPEINGRVIIRVPVSAAATRLSFNMAGSSNTGTIDNISVREIATVPLSQTVLSNSFTAVRMPLTGRRNLVTASEDMGSPTLSGVTNAGAYTGALPKGVLQATQIRETSATSSHFFRWAFGAEVAAGTNGFSIKILPQGRTRFQVLPERTGSSLWAGVTVDLASKTVTNNIASANQTVNAGSVEEDEEGFYTVKIKFTSSVGYTGLLFCLLNDSVSGTSLAPSYAGDADKGCVVTARQIEVAEPTHYQRVTSANDVHEDGVPDVWGIVSDYAGDVLSATLPFAIDGEILIAGTKGTIIEPVSYASGSTFNLGTDTYTGGTPGILRAIGPIVGVVLLDRAFTEDEKTQLIDYYKGKGAKGLLVPGPELVTNGTFDTGIEGWTASAISGSNPAILSWIEGGGMQINSGEGSRPGAYQSIDTVAGGVYLGLVERFSGVNPIQLRAGLSPNGAEYGSVNTASGTGTSHLASYIFTATSSASFVNVSTFGAGVNSNVSTVSARELRPQEDW